MVSLTESSPARVLVVTPDRAVRDQLARVFTPPGYVVHTARTGGQSLARARLVRPAVVVMDDRVPDVTPADLCHRLRPESGIGAWTPMVVMMSPGAGRNDRLAALRAGAWDVMTRPVDYEALFVRVETYREAARSVRRELMVDPVTGLYNVVGIARRARELAASAYRRRAPLACLAVASAIASQAEDPAVEEAVRALARLLRSATRESDIVGHIGRGAFLVIAPDTDEGGAVECARRLARAKDRDAAAELRVGYYAVANARETPIDPIQLLARAMRALHATDPRITQHWIRPNTTVERGGG